MRQRISEKNVFPNFSLENEYKKLHDLFTFSGIMGSQIFNVQSIKKLSYYDLLRLFFLDWELRGSFTTIEEMLAGLNINSECFVHSTTEDRVLDYIQFVANAVAFVNCIIEVRGYGVYKSNDTISKAIATNSKLILNKLGAELVVDGAELFVIYSDDIATAVANDNIGLKASITEYQKIDNRGDLTRKGEVLCTLAKKLEPHEKLLNGTEFHTLCADTTYLLNAIGARHALDPNDKTKAAILSMNETEIEKWYDRTFQMILSCMAALPYLEYKSEIKVIKAGKVE